MLLPRLNKFILLLASLFVLISCRSTKKYNDNVTRTLSVEEMAEDVDFLFNKLEKRHPRLYEYISEEELQQKVKDFKSSLKPMTSIAFYHKLYPLVSEIRQGHLRISPAFPIRERKERKRYRRANSQFDDLSFTWIDDQVYIKKTKGKLDSLLVGSKVIAIDSVPTERLVKRWADKFASDGYNTTFQSPIVARNLITYYRYDVGRTDSVTLHLQKGDSVFKKQLKIIFQDSKNKKDTTEQKETSKDSLAQKKDTLPKLTRAEKKLKKKKRREKYRNKRKQGFGSREFKRIGNDSNIAYLRIKKFSGGDRWSKKFYEETFKTIDSLQIEHLILDLRDNTGGSLKEIGRLYSFMATEDFQFIQPIETKTKLLITNRMWSGRPSLIGNFFKMLFTPFTLTGDLLKTKKSNGKIYYNNKNTKIQPPHPLAFDGDIYVLINGVSFSASSILSSNLHGSKRAIFIGEETGGAYNGTVAGLYKSTFLPNSELFLPVWMMQIETPYKDEPHGYGIKPDIEVKPKLEDFLNEKDTVLERALQEIEGD
jgi:C-terminal processing protease CtpA/Prc